MNDNARLEMLGRRLSSRDHHRSDFGGRGGDAGGDLLPMQSDRRDLPVSQDDSSQLIGQRYADTIDTGPSWLKVGCVIAVCMLVLAAVVTWVLSWN